jgi:nucleoside-triphosphatase
LQQKRVLILTGNPGVGKTTVLTKTVEMLRNRGYTIGGMLSREFREGGVRVGFEIQDLAGGKRGWLAHVYQKSGPSVGKYHVNLEDLDNVGAQAITEAVEHADVVAIDEIGPMELFSGKFKGAAQKALESEKLVLAVVHYKAQDKLLAEAKSNPASETVVVTIENREKLPEFMAAKVLAFLEQCC